MRGTNLIRGGLLFFAGVCAVLGGVIVLWPDAFFSLSWVNMGMAYNPHLLLDYGRRTWRWRFSLAAPRRR